MPRKVNINSIRNLIQYRKKINTKAIEDDIVSALSQEGKRLMQLAYASRGFANITKNLKDSYCYGVYDKGKLVKKGFLSSAPDAERTNRGWSGRDEAEAFLSQVGKQINRKGFSLVIGVALFYGSILEAGKPPLRKKYRVLANIEMDLRDLRQSGVKGYKYKTVYDANAEYGVKYRVDNKV